MQRERIKKLKIACYVLVLVLLFVLETANGSPAHMFGYRIDVLPFAVISIALLDGPVEGGAMGVVAGILYDVAFPKVQGISPILYLLLGIGVGLLGKRLLRRIYPSVLLLGTATMILLGVWRLLILLIWGQMGDALLYLRSACGQALVAAACSWVPYLVVRQISRRFARSEST